MLRFVTATRMGRRAFSARAPLCLSLGAAAQHGGLLVQAYPDNSSPLPTLYNQALDAAGADDVLVFAHDDLWVDDWWVAKRLEEALAHFDVIGVAGNRRRLPGQCRWWWDDARAARDDPHLSGSVAHGKPNASKLTVYGPTPA